MFKAKYKKDNQTYQILDTHFNEMFQQIYFLYWDTNKQCWAWENASNFLPPNINE